MQSWPVLKVAPSVALAANSVTSASAKIIKGALPPSSRWTRFKVSAAVFITVWPVWLEPVRLTIRSSGCSTNACPVSLSPVITLTTPAGIPASAVNSASFSVVNGVVGAGFKTTVQPAASAGPIFHTAIING